MLKVLLVGNSPLPNEGEKIRPAAGLRTYQFLRAIQANTDFEIKLVKIAMPEAYDKKLTYSEEKKSEFYSEITIAKNFPGLEKKLQKIIDKYRPDIVVGINTYPSYLLAKLNFKVPFWADLNGWIMAEAQAQAFKLNSNDYLSHYFKMEKKILKRADKFSCVSKAQSLAILGELATLGRLNKESFDYHFVHHIPNATEWFESEKFEQKTPQDVFNLLWVGGYNTWVDEDTLYKGVVKAMESCPKLYFLSTGGEIKGLDDKTFARFKKMVEASEFKDRFIFLGWVNSEDIPALYAKAQAGINVDRDCVETFTGARNRINEMMKFGLPVITTRGSEIADAVREVGAGITIKSGDSDELAIAIKSMYLDWKDDKDKLKEYGENGQRYIKEKCNYKIVSQEFLNWLTDEKTFAPDKNLKVSFGLFAKIKSALFYLRRNGLKKALAKLRA